MRTVVIALILALGWGGPCQALCAVTGAHAGSDSAPMGESAVPPCHSADPPASRTPEAPGAQCCGDHGEVTAELLPAPALEGVESPTRVDVVIAFATPRAPRASTLALWHPPDRPPSAHPAQNPPLRL